MYRVTPVFQGDNLVASGVQMEACSVEDRGEELSFNVFVFNVQPGITIDYATGESRLSGQDEAPSSGAAQTAGEIRGNSKSKIYHCPGQASYDDLADSAYLVTFSTEQEAQNAGYRKAKK